MGILALNAQMQIMCNNNLCAYTAKPWYHDKTPIKSVLFRAVINHYLKMCFQKEMS